MNRGHGGEKILHDETAKTCFLDILERRSASQKIRVFTYCVMDNHYHPILQSSSGRLSEFMKQLNGEYGTWYRRREEDPGTCFRADSNRLSYRAEVARNRQNAKMTSTSAHSTGEVLRARRVREGVLYVSQRSKSQAKPGAPSPQ
jgi:hypothetical protein